MSTLYTGGFPFVMQHTTLDSFLDARLDNDHIAHYLLRDVKGDFQKLAQTLAGINKEIPSIDKFNDFIAKYNLTNDELNAVNSILEDMSFAEKLLKKDKIKNIGFRIITEYSGYTERVYNFHHDNTCRILCSYNPPHPEWVDPSETDITTFDEYDAHDGARIYTFPPGTFIRCNKRFIHRAPTELPNGGARFLLVIDYHD
jgi:hypothetical protein